MTDDSGRRERRQFEPPPWERDKFDEIARSKAEEEGREARPQAPQAEAAAPDRPAEPVVVAPVLEVVGAKREPAAVDERKIAAMLIQLSGEEGPATKPMVEAGRYAAITLMSLGALMIVAAVVYGVRAPVLQGKVGAILIAMIGALVAGFAGWMWVRANREQGS